MSRRVVCFSGLYGSEMRAVARTVAEALGLALVDEDIILRAAAEGGVDPQVVASVESRRSFVERALEALGPTVEATKFAYGGWAEPVGPGQPASDELRGLIRTAIEETAGRGNVVIVSHAASHALGQRPGVLRVLVTASHETRRDRVAALAGVGEPEAERELADSDAARADYLKRFYGVKSEAPTQYDLVLNTDRLSVAEAAALVVLAAGD